MRKASIVIFEIKFQTLWWLELSLSLSCWYFLTKNKFSHGWHNFLSATCCILTPQWSRHCVFAILCQISITKKHRITPKRGEKCMHWKYWFFAKQNLLKKSGTERRFDCCAAALKYWISLKIHIKWDVLREIFSAGWFYDNSQ